MKTKALEELNSLEKQANELRFKIDNSRNSRDYSLGHPAITISENFKNFRYAVEDWQGHNVPEDKKLLFFKTTLPGILLSQNGDKYEIGNRFLDNLEDNLEKFFEKCITWKSLLMNGNRSISKNYPYAEEKGGIGYLYTLKEGKEKITEIGKANNKPFLLLETLLKSFGTFLRVDLIAQAIGYTGGKTIKNSWDQEERIKNTPIKELQKGKKISNNNLKIDIKNGQIGIFFIVKDEE